MSYKRTIILAALVALVLFVLFNFDLIQKIPGFYCEGFACMALGILLMMAPVYIALLFFVGGALAAKQRRLKAGLVSAGIAFAFAVLAVILIGIFNTLQVNRATAEACREDPKTYCPETLYKCTVSGNVTKCINPDALPSSSP